MWNSNKSKASSVKHYGVARVLSKRGVCSRSEAERACREGRVKLRGKTVYDPETPATEKDEISLDGASAIQEEKIYIAFHKPRGVITTASDEKGRKTVLDFFRGFKHIAPVGRLDAASEGLLLLTNDTDFANRILEPGNSGHLEKTYHVQISGIPSEAELLQMEQGMLVPARVFGESEEFMHAKSAKILRHGEKNCWLEIVLDEGKNREIRRMCKKLGFETLRLVRIKIGPYELGDLKPGEHRLLTL